MLLSEAKKEIPAKKIPSKTNISVIKNNKENKIIEKQNPNEVSLKNSDF